MNSIFQWYKSNRIVIKQENIIVGSYSSLVGVAMLNTNKDDK
jgi:hypothetical protein